MGTQNRDVRMTLQSLRVLEVFLDVPADELSGADVIKRSGIASGTLYPTLLRLESAGGTFNVRLTGRGIDLMVLDGVVGASAPRVTDHRTAHVGLSPPTLEKAGQTIDIEPDGQSGRSKSQPEAQARIAWQQG
jgi:hypothetical protein